MLALREKLSLSILLAGGALGVWAGCSESGEPPTVILEPDTGGVEPPSDGGKPVRDGPSPASTLRLVHLAAGLGPIDFCTRVGAGDPFVGPVLGRDRDGGAPDASDAGQDAGQDAEQDGSKRDAEVMDAGAVPLPYLAASQYTPVEGSGTVELAIVPYGTSSCASPLATRAITLDPGKLTTVVVYGREGADSGAPAGIVAFNDISGVIPDKARLRMIHAVGEGAPPLTVTVYASLTTTLGTLEPLGILSSSTDAAAIESLGYATLGPRPAPATLGLVESGDGGDAGSWLSQSADLGLTGGTLHTGFIVRQKGSYAVLYCNDVSTEGPRTLCGLLGPP